MPNENGLGAGGSFCGWGVGWIQLVTLPIGSGGMDGGVCRIGLLSEISESDAQPLH